MLNEQPKYFPTWLYISILFVVTASTCYYLIFHGNFIQLDDINLILRLLNAPTLQLKELFFSQTVQYYYRPIVELSYRLEYFFWFDIPLTNVILHFLNVYFIYLLGLLLIQNLHVDKKIVFIAARYIYITDRKTREGIR
jgi:hypothetical protein